MESMELQTNRLEELKGEILAIDRETGWHIEQAAKGVLEIGQRLLEVKGLVPGGKWQQWMEENLQYSQRKAQQLMQYYERYGTGQQSLFGGCDTREKVLELGYSKAVALMTLDDEQQEEFLEEHPDAEDMSARQLQQAVREKLEAQKREREAVQARTEAELREQARARELEETKLQLENSRNQLQEAMEKSQREKEQLEAQAASEKQLEEMRDKWEKSKGQLEKQKSRVKSLEDKLKKLEEETTEKEEKKLEELKRKARETAEEELEEKLREMENRLEGAAKKTAVAGVNAKLTVAQDAFRQAMDEIGGMDEGMKGRLRPVLMMVVEGLRKMAEEI